MTLRARLTIWYTALLVSALSIFSAAVLTLHWRALVSEQDEQLYAMGAAAARTMNNEFAETGDPAAAAEEAEDLPPAGVIVRIVDEHGQHVARASEPTPYGPVSPQPGSLSMRGSDARTWRVTIAPASIGRVRYFVQTSAPLDDALKQRAVLLRACLLGLPLVIVVAGGGGWWLAGRALGPLARMAREAERINAAAPDQRLTMPLNTAELQQVAASFNRLLDRLATALAEQRTFMADASHELRTPLASIRAAADVTLARGVRDASEYRDALTAIAQQSRHLGRIVDDMLLLARADGGGYPVSVAEVDVTAVVVECVEDLLPGAVERNIDLAISAADRVTIAGDESLVRRLALNLISNAIAYTPAGGAVRVSITSDGGAVSLRVADTGPGVPESDRERIFDRFVRLDPSRHQGGAGLGLAIARWIAELHGGRVAIERSGPEGSVFVARFAPTPAAVIA